MTRFLTLSLAGCLTLAWSVGEAQTTAKPYAYNMKTTVSRPAGSAAAASFANKKNPSTTALTPCELGSKRDVLSFQLVYDAGKRVFNKDGTLKSDNVSNVYFLFYNPEGLGLDPILADNVDPTDPNYPEKCEIPSGFHACDPKIWVLDRPAVGVAPLAMRPLESASAIDFTNPDYIYLEAAENLGTGKITDTMLRSYMRFDDLKQGLWSLIGLIGPVVDSNPPVAVAFDNPSTWAAWDSVTFMLGSPWENGKPCD